MSECRTPWKMQFASRREALTVVKNGRKKPKSGQMRAYRCACGFWHLSSMSRHQAHRVKKGALA